jgi:predicted permease
VTDALGRDLRLAARALRTSPGLVLVATLSLALGIGANVTVFGWARAVLLEPFSGVPAQDRLVKVLQTDPNEEFVSFSYPDYRDLRDRATTLAGLAAVRNVPATLAAEGRGERVWMQLVSGNFFEVLGVGSRTGRTLTPADDRVPNAHPVVVLGHALWQRRFGGDPGVVGRTVVINTRAYTVLGVTPPRFRGAGTGVAYDAWVPMMMQEHFEPGGSRLEARGHRWLEAYARLAPGRSREEAQAELTVLSARIAAENERESLGRGVALFPLWRAPRSGAEILGPVVILLAAVSLIVLLLACANLASLLLARGVGRRREIAIRLSLGARRFQVVRQLLAESLLLALAGGVAGLAVASSTVGLLEAWVPPTGFPVSLGARIDGAVVAFATVVAFLTALAFGLAPALQTVRPETADALRDESSGVVGGCGRSRLRSGLVVAQVALSVLLLVAAGLFARTLQRLQSADLGFEPRGVLVASMELFTGGYDRERGLAFYRELVEQARSLPGVTDASLVRRAPLGFGGSSSTSLAVEGYVPPKDGEVWAYFNNVGPGYFRLMRTALVKGRELTGDDREDKAPVAVVNETMAARYWPGRDPVGGRFRLGERWVSVVGVVRNTAYRDLGERPAPWFFLPLFQGYRPDMTLLVRTDGDAEALTQPVTDLVRRLDAGVVPFGVTTLSAFIGAADFRQRVGSQLLGLFGVLGLVLACVGLYGVLSFAVARRTREIGIRMALGGARRDIFRLVLRQGAALVSTGLVLGLAAAGAASRLLRSLLLDLSPWDPMAFAGVAALLLGAGLVACAVPARRATRVDPVSTLRQE